MNIKITKARHDFSFCCGCKKHAEYRVEIARDSRDKKVLLFCEECLHELPQTLDCRIDEYYSGRDEK